MRQTSMGVVSCPSVAATRTGSCSAAFIQDKKQAAADALSELERREKARSRIPEQWRSVGGI